MLNALVAAERPALQWERVEINSSVPEDAEVAAIVKVYQDLIGERAPLVMQPSFQ
jgi:hypothetical protein